MREKKNRRCLEEQETGWRPGDRREQSRRRGRSLARAWKDLGVGGRR